MSSSSPNSVRSFNVAMSNNDADAKVKDHDVRPDLYRVQEFRSQIFRLSACVGNLSTLFLEEVPLDSLNPNEPNAPVSSKSIQRTVTELLSRLIAAAEMLSLNLQTAIVKKMELNRRKYPVELCRGKAGKYTEYSDATGITRDGQSTLDLVPSGSTDIPDPSSSLWDNLASLIESIRHFANERNWARYHKPRNLLLALTGELGEISELFQWLPDETQTLSEQEVDKAGQELADVSIYLLRLVDVCGITLIKEINE